MVTCFLFIFEKTYSEIIRSDDDIAEVISQINTCVDESFLACKTVVSYLNKYSFLWAIDITQAFKEFLRSNKYHDKTSVSKNFVSGAK